MKKTDVFFCYREAGAQTAKLFKRYLQRIDFPGEVWYSDLENVGNYKADPVPLLGQATCAVMFIDKNFTEGFSNSDCVTAAEVLEIVKNKKARPDKFTVITIFLSREAGFSEEEAKTLESLLVKNQLSREDAQIVTKCNQVVFNTRKDDEQELFDKLKYELLPNSFFQQKKRY